VRTGVLDDKAEQWLPRLEDEEKVKAMRTRAEGGTEGDNIQAMETLGLWYMLGQHGLQVDHDKGYELLKRGADLGSVSCMTKAALVLLDQANQNITSRISHGVYLLMTAAEEGSAMATTVIAKCHHNGKLGWPIDLAQAKKWYAKVPYASVHDASKMDIALAADQVVSLGKQLEQS